MSTELVNTCPSCGAQESLDVVLARMFAEPVQRQLIASVIERSMPMGNKVVRYLRLHKPSKQALSVAKLKRLLDELLPAVTNGIFEHRGIRQISLETWGPAFDAVFEAADKGTITPPLNGHAYLFSVAMRMDESAAAQEEAKHEAERRHQRPAHTSAAATDIAALMQQPAQASVGHKVADAYRALGKQADARAPAPAPGQSPLVRKMKAEMEAKKNRIEQGELKLPAELTSPPPQINTSQGETT